MDPVDNNEADWPPRVRTVGEGSKEVIARILAMVGGYVDGAGYVALFQLFIAHQSGNSAGLGAALSGGAWTDVWRRSIAIGAFVGGVALGTLVVELGRFRAFRSSGAIVGVIEIAAMIGAIGIGLSAAPAGYILPADTPAYALAAACLAGAMGLQTVTLRRVGRRTVRTTFVTGVLTDVAENLVASWFDPDAKARRRLRSNVHLLGSVWLLYLGGAVAGAAAQRAWSFAALAIPITMVAIVSCWQFSVGHRPSVAEDDGE